MKKYFIVLFVFCLQPLVFSQSGWNYLTLGPHVGLDNSLYNFNLKLDHFKQKKGDDIYSKYYYRSLSLNYGFDNKDIFNYSMQFSFNFLKKRLFEYYDKWYFKKQNIPPEKRNFIHITGLRLYPTIILGPAIYNFAGDQSYYFRPGVGMVLNYGHFSTWDADFRLIMSYQYNYLISGQKIPGLKENILSVQIGVGFKLKSK